MTTAFPDHRATVTPVALPVSSGAMMRRLAEAAVLPERFRTRADRGRSARRETFVPLGHDLVLMWVATGLLSVAMASLVAGVLLVR
jgi:hypothetical protein